MTILAERAVDAAAHPVEQDPPTELPSDDLAAFAAWMVSTWPRLNADRKRELGRLLAS